MLTLEDNTMNTYSYQGYPLTYTPVDKKACLMVDIVASPLPPGYEGNYTLSWD